MNSESLIEVVRQFMEVEPSRVPYRFLLDDGREESLSYAELDNAAKILAANLQASCRPGDRALLLFHPGLEYIKALFGCFYAGVVAVPVYPPTNKRNSERIKLIADNAGVGIALTERNLSERMRQFFDIPDWLVIDESLPRKVSDYSEYRCSAESLAFLQYTSGSTGNPKGVMLSHANLLHNAMLGTRAMGVSRSSVFVSWLPPYHDMGLIGTILEPLLKSAQMILMSPAAFMQSPYRWLKAISDYRGTHSGGPNFTFDLCVEKVSDEQKTSLDLSSWNVAFNGAEPVRRETLDAFFSAFEQCGFKRKAFYPSYGLAEATLFVSGGGVKTEPVIKRIDAQALEQNIVVPIDGGKGVVDCVGCGRSTVDHGVLIVDPETGVPCPPDRIGEIWVAGDSVAQGYWNLSEDESNPFDAYPTDSDLGPYLRTGDLGFMDNGELFITGRLKDLIILNGRNLYPQDIESCSWKSHSSLRLNAAAAFSCVVDGVEELVVVQELGFRNKADTGSILSSIRRAISEEFQVQPYAIVLTKPGKVPVTSSGKIRRRECRRLYESGSIKQEALWVRDHDESTEAFDSSTAVSDIKEKQINVGMRSVVETELTRIWAELLALEIGAIRVDDNFFDLGGYSMLALRLQRNINKHFNVNISIVDIFKYPTVRQLAEHPQFNGTVPVRKPRKSVSASQHQANDPIAIIGMSGRFPKASDLDEFWRNLEQGVEAISFYDEEELLKRGVDKASLQDPAYVKAGVVFDGIEEFDAEFFGISPREATMTDPGRRLLLESAYHALENAGYAGDLSGTRVGVYVGTSFSRYLVDNVLPHLDTSRQHDAMPALLANDSSFSATQLSYKLNLSGGPSVSVNTACSTSLVAIGEACYSLQAGRCDIALAGGAAVHNNDRGYWYQEDGILSRDGHCRAFDADASGTVFGSGAGVIVLKRLSDAVEDGDCIHAVIKSVAISNDGADKVGYTAPSVSGQSETILDALNRAQVSADSISYVEAHGTGTSIGDPIEVTALTEAWRTQTDGKQYCALGSVKSNVGHLDTAAGVAGLMKTVLSFQHGRIPASLGFERPNPAIDFENTPFYVNTHAQDWTRADIPRRAAVSSFGIGGTNAHAILEEAPPQVSTPSGRRFHLLPLSARSESALTAMRGRLAQHLASRAGELNIADVAFTLQHGRRGLKYRTSIVCSDCEDAVKQLETGGASFAAGDSRKVVFMFPGQGSQHLSMLRDLYRHEDLFRDIVDECCRLLKPILKLDLLEIIFADEGDTKAADLLKQTWITQPALFCVQYALAQLWMSVGIRPHTMIGHSIGEYVAACIAGVFSLPDALRLVAARGRLIQELSSPGVMLAVSLPEGELGRYMNDELSLAAVNSPGQCVVGGSKEAIDELAEVLKSSGITCSVLRTSHAFHSHLLDPVAEAFKLELESVQLNKATIPYISNISGTWVNPDEVGEAGYWTRHLRATVRFADGINTLLADGDYIFLEVGPERTLSSLSKSIAANGGRSVQVVSSARRARNTRPDDAVFWSALGELWSAGVSPDWTVIYDGEDRRRVPLPAYPFERQKFWMDSANKGIAETVDAAAAKNLDDWFYLPAWEPSLAPVTALQPEPGKAWLIVAGLSGPGDKIAGELEALGQQVIQVTPGKRFAKHSDSHFSLRLTEASDYAALFTDCKARDVSLDHLIHCCSLADGPGADVADIFLEPGFNSLLSLLRQVVSLRKQSAGNLMLTVVSDHMQQVLGNEDVQPSKAALLALCRVVGQEFAEVDCSCVDIETTDDPDIARNIVNEALMQSHGKMVAYRNGRRWVQSFKRVALPARNTAGGLFKPGGVYLCAGGLGNIALELIERISATVGDCAFILTSRRQLPPAEDWEHWLETCAADEGALADKIRRLLTLRNKGVRLLTCSADIADEAAMRSAFSLAQQHFGRIDGVLHAAGDVSTRSFAPIDQLDSEHFRVNCRAKVGGLHVLDAVLQDVPVDFCILMSSVSSVLGGLGYTAYSAANIYLDMFVQHKHARGDRRWLSINWDAWEFDMSDEAAMLQMRLVPMTPSEGAEAFIRLTSVRAGPQVLVSKTDFQARLARLDEVKSEQNALTVKTVLHARPSLQTAYVPATTKTEARLIDLMGGLLGIENIGVDDSFYDLGGDSLLLSQASNVIRKEFPGTQVNVQDIFENPTVARLAAIIEGQVVSCDDNGTESIPLLPLRDTYEMSPAQLRLWLTYQVDSGSSAYHELDAMRVPSSWNRQAFENAMNCLIERHEPLRTVFVHQEGTPRQKILPPFKLNLEEKSVAAESELQQLINEYRALPFDLTRGPLLRMTLVRVSDTGQSLLLWCMHEIIGDGSSLVILSRELSQLMAQNDESKLPSIGTQYKDFAAWQNRLLESEAGQRSRDYWHDQLQGDIPRIDLPFDYPLTPDSHKGGAAFQFALPRDFRNSLESFARSRQTTLFMVLQSALSVLFMRLCGQRDITLAVPVSGRQHADVQSMLGFFLNTLLLRHQIDDSDSFLSLLDKVKSDTLQGLAHQYYPFERLLDELRVSRVPNAFPVTPVVLNMLSFTNLDSDSDLQSRINFTDDALKSDIQDYHDTKVELEIYIIGHSDGLRFRINYRTALFRRETVEYLMSEFVHLLEQLLKAPEQRLIEHAVFAQPRRVGELDYPASLNSAWLAFQGPVEQELAWDHMLAAVYQQVQSQPEACAVAGSNISLSYARLWRRVQTCSSALRSAGIERGAVLGVVTEDGLERLVGLLGGLHAGAIVTPFSCTEPVARQRRMVEQVEPVGWLVDGSGISRLSELGIGERVPVLNIGNLVEDGVDALEPPVCVDGEAASYIFFTSGSSGEPKPILGRAASLSHFIQWEMEEYGLGPGSRISQLAAPTFDASLRDIFTALCSGGTACLPPAAAGEMAPESLLDWLEQAQVTLMHTVPSLFRTLLAAEPSAERLADLKHVLLAGEPLYGTDVKRWRSVFGERIELTNLYGATETTLVKCYHRVAAADARQERVPIGRPMPGCKAIILDALGRICPRGQVGELHLRTPYTSLGYYRRPEASAAVFIANPLVPDSDERIYKTGDLARQRPDGLYEILGRKDDQLKIRGVRVEPGEVENQLLDCPGVEQAAVLGVAGSDGDVELHAHLGAKANLNLDTLRRLLSERLPPAFVPNRFHVHEQLPLTATGKIDRKALQNQAGPVLTDYEPPEGEIEQALAQIWCEVLNVERVGRNDDFFAIGGHSLKVLQVIAKTRKVFEVDVYPRALFEAPTLTGFAARLLDSKQQSFEPIDPVEEQPRYPASFAQFRLWLQHELRPQTAAHNVFLVIELAEHWDIPMLRWVLNRLVERHESLRTVFEHDEDKLFQKIWPSFEIDLPERQVDSEYELAEHIKVQAGKRFDLSSRPLVRAQVLHTWDNRRLLLWCTHEIIGDGSSLAILQREIERLMQAYRAGVELPRPRVHYKDFAVWQRRKLVVEDSPARAYWHQQLQGPITWLDLPFDYPLTGESDWGSQVYEFRLPGELNAGLNRLAKSQQTTLFMLLQSALSTLLMRLTGRQDIILAAPVAGREHPDVQSIVGFFVSTILLRHKVDPQQKFVDLLEQVKQTTMDGLEHQQYPFDRLIDELDLPRGANRFPVTPVIFNMLSFFEKGMKSEIGAEKYTIPAAAYHRGHRSIERHARVELELYAYEDEGGVGFQCHYRSSLFKPTTIEYLLDEFQRLLLAVVRSPEATLNSYKVLDGIEASRATWAKQTEEPVSVAYLPPEGETEELLARIWSEVLGIQQVGRNDNFFAIGGHSIKALLMLSRIRKELNIIVRPRVLFEAPTLAGFAAQLFKEERRQFEPIEPVDEQPRYPASSQQFRLWLQQQLRPQSVAHNGARTVELETHWDSDMLHWVLNKLVERHESLRTIFEFDNNELFQKILPPFEVSLPESYVENEAELNEKIKAHMGGVFDLAVCPQFRLALLHTWDGRRILLWCIHEINSDGSSLVILQQEMHRLIRAYREEEELPSPRIQYKDFAVWQRKQTADKDNPARVYWHQQLQGPVERLELPFDYPLTAQSDWLSRIFEIRMPEQLESGLERLAQSQQATMFMVLQSALSTLLMRLTGHQDIFLAAPITGREHPDVQSIMGLFVNPVLFRHSVEAEQTFTELLGRVKQTTIDGLVHQSYPFDRLIDELDLPRGANAFPVTPVIFNMLSFLEAELMDGIGAEKYISPTGDERVHRSVERHARCEFELYAVKDGEGLCFQCHYRSALFKPETIEYLMDEFIRLLEAVVQSPESRLAGYPVLAEIDPPDVSRVRQDRQDFEEAPVVYRPPEGDVEERLARIWSEVLGVERIGRDDNFFAIGGHSLKALLTISKTRKVFDVGIDPRVLFESPTLAGFAAQLSVTERQQFEPIKPAEEQSRYPASFQQFRLWLQQQLRPQTIAHNACRMIELEAYWDNDMLHWVLNRLVERHASLRTIFELDGTELFQKVLPAVEIDLPECSVASEAELDEKITEYTGRVYDLSEGPLFRTTLVHTWDGRRMLLWCMHEINADGSSFVILRNDAFRLVQAYRDGTELPALRIQYKDFSVWQHQQSVDSDGSARTYWHRQLQGPVERLDLPFDYPLTAKSDWSSRIFELIVPGELYAGLDQLAQSQQATVYMVLQSALSAFLMRLTGQQDVIIAAPVVGREHPDVQFIVGLFVNAVLLRHRVEPSQTLTGLLGQVKQTIVDGLVHHGYPFDRLIDELDLPRGTNAFPVTPVIFNMLSFIERGSREEIGIGAETYMSPTKDERAHRSIERHARCELELTVFEYGDGLCFRCYYRAALYKPETIEYLMDEFKKLLEAVVRSPQARLDSYPILTEMDPPEVWRARRDRQDGEMAPVVVYRSPEGDVEDRLARIWSEVLGVEQVGRDDNFFALGGHSLKALLAISKTRKAFDVDVHPRALFDSPTLAGFASLLSGAGHDTFESIEPVDDQARYEATPAQFRLWLQHELHPNSSAHNVSSAIELTADWEPAVIRWVLNRLIERHEALRTVFEREADTVYQRVLPPFEVELPESRWESEAELIESIRQHSVEPFDLIRGPLFRARLLHGRDERRILLWCMHEIVADGSSSVILRREINQLKTAHHDNAALPQAPRIQYKDFAAWQRQQFAAENNPARAYWHRQLGGSVTALDLPFDHPLTNESDWNASAYEHRLPAALKTRLNELAQSRQVTLFMLLQSALSTLLMRLTGQHDIVLAVPVSGREHPDVQSTVGFFLNTVLLRHRVDSERTFTDLLEQVRRTTLEGLEQQHYPFEQLLEELDLPRYTNRFPVTPVMFNMLNFVDSRDSSSVSSLTANRLFRDGKTEFEMDALDVGEDLRLRVFYRSALFKASTVEYLVGELVNFLDQVVDDPVKRLAEYDLFGQCEVAGEFYPEALNSAYLDFVGDYQ